MSCSNEEHGSFLMERQARARTRARLRVRCVQLQYRFTGHYCAQAGTHFAIARIVLWMNRFPPARE
jgi:hypothetical protein